MQNNKTNQKDILEKINRASLKFLTPLTSRETYATIVKEALKLMDGKDGVIILKDGRLFKKVYTSSTQIDTISIRKRGYVYTSLTQNRIFIMTESDIKSSHPEVLKQGIKSNLLIPLSYQKNTVGVLLIRFKENKQFSPELLEILRLFGSMASLAIKKTQLYDETKKALDTRDLFIALASHELKTPLTSINLYSQLLDKTLSQEKHPASKWTDKLLAESNRLTLLTNELLEVNQIKTGQFKYEWQMNDLQQIIQRAITNTHVVYPSASILFTHTLGRKKALVMGDFNKLVQVLINVLSNAAKFTSQDKKIMIQLSHVTHTYLIDIIDEGRGIPPEDIEKIFDRFYKASSNYEEGMGLGLFLTKKIIEDHKGNISISSQIGKGTTVKIVLPKE